MPPDFLVVGHIVKDIDGDGWRIGGSIAYATLQASRLGLSCAAVTACGPEINASQAMPWTQCQVLPSMGATTFENLYEGGERRQWLRDIGAPIDLGAIAGDWLRAPIVFLAPVAGELSEDAAAFFPRETLVGIGAQGFLRRRTRGPVRGAAFDPRAAWLHGDVVFVSDEDVKTPERAEEWAGRVPMVILTRGARGCTVWANNSCYQVPAFEAEEVDPTGAGDVFAAAFLVRWQETNDALESARFASAAGSLAVRGKGLDSVAGRQEIEGLLRSARTAAR